MPRPRPRRALALTALGAAAVPALAAAGILLLAAGGGAGRAFESGAYVQNVSQTRAVIAMVTAAEVRLRVEVRPARPDAAAAAPRVVVEPAPARLHGLALDGLEPDTSYRYAVYDAETLALREEATFRTAPPPGAREIVFAAFGDTGGEIEHVGAGYGLFARIGGFLAGGPWRGRQGELARRVLEDRPELCLHTGDVVYPVGAREAYAEAFFRPFAPLIREVPLFPVVGNHDVMTEGGKPFDEVFHTPANNPQKSPRYYSFDWGDVHFVALDSFSKKAMQRDGPQIQWLMEDLARSRAPWKVCFLHEPPFSEGKKHDSKKVQHRLLPTFEALGVDLVLSGHDHNYQRFRPIRGITYLVTGGGGVSTYDVAASERTAAAREVFHYVRGRADAHRLILEAVDFDGHVFDSVRLEKGAAR